MTLVMEKYRILPHIADGKFQAFGATLEEAFANAALATAALMWDWWKIKKKISFSLTIQGRDLEQLLYKFLEEILFSLDAKNILVASVEDLKIEQGEGGFRLNAVFWGDEALHHYEIFGDVKAITYNEMKIEKAGECWSVQVVVDM
jgi:SHS2 domain-containing protein